MTTLALIGIGEWGQNYLHTTATLKNVEIKYICAQTQQTLNLFPDTYIKTLSINDLLKYKDIEGFIIATAGSTHFAIAKQLLSLGCNLLIEKPLTVSYKEALELQKIWQIKKSKILVGHLYLYNPAYQVLKRLLKNIRKVKSIQFEGQSSPIRTDVSVIWDWGPHPISMLLDLINQPLVEVAANGLAKNPSNKLYETANASLYFENGLKASIYISWQGLGKVRKLTIEGKEERIEFDDTNTTHQKVLLYRPNETPQYPQYKLKPPLAEELMEFVQAIKGSKKISSDINLGVSVVKVLSAIEQSIEKGGRLIKIK